MSYLNWLLGTVGDPSRAVDANSNRKVTTEGVKTNPPQPIHSRYASSQQALEHLSYLPASIPSAIHTHPVKGCDSSTPSHRETHVPFLYASHTNRNDHHLCSVSPHITTSFHSRFYPSLLFRHTLHLLFLFSQTICAHLCPGNRMKLYFISFFFFFSFFYLADFDLKVRITQVQTLWSDGDICLCAKTKPISQPDLVFPPAKWSLNRVRDKGGFLEDIGLKQVL